MCVCQGVEVMCCVVLHLGGRVCESCEEDGGESGDLRVADHAGDVQHRCLGALLHLGGGVHRGGVHGRGGGDVGWFVGVCEGGWVGGGGVVLPWGVGLIPRPRVEARSEADRRTADRIGGGGGQAGTSWVG